MADISECAEAEEIEVLPNLPKDFMLTRITIPKDQNTDKPVIRFDDGKDKFVVDDIEPCNNVPRPNLYDGADAEREKCLVEMRRFAEVTGIELPDSQNLTWNHVESFMNTTVKQNRIGEFAEVAHQFSERVGDNGPAIQAWLDLLPGGEYSSLICGSFKLLISGAIKKAQLRKRIIDAISSIPGMLQNAKEFFDIYKSTGQSRLSINLDKAFANLVSAILSACINMFQYLRRDPNRFKEFGHSLKRYSKAVMKQNNYGGDIDEHISAVRVAADEVKKQAFLGLHSGVRGIQSDVREILRLVVDDNRMLRDNCESLKADINVLNNYLAIFKYNKCIDDIEKHREQYEAKAIEDKVRPEPTRRVTQSMLMNRLNFKHESVNKDLRSAMSAGNTSTEKDQERSRFVIYSPKFRSWLERQKSELLFVEGNSESARISPMSFTCALLATTMGSKPDVIVLSYICGAHTTTKKSPTGPQMMLHSLLGQLLQKYDKFDIGFLESPGTSTVPKKLDRKDISQMSRIFEVLIKQLPRDKVVFCIIDGVSFYEWGANREDNVQVLAALAAIVRLQESNAAFKLLIMTPVRSRHVKLQIASSRNILTVPEEIPRTNQGFTLTQLRRAGHKEMADVKVRPPKRVKTGWSFQESDEAEEVSSSDSDGWCNSENDSD